MRFEMRVACLHAVDIKCIHRAYLSFSCLGLALTVQKLHLERLAEGLQEMLCLQGMEDEDKLRTSYFAAMCRSVSPGVPAGVAAGDCNRLLPSRGLVASQLHPPLRAPAAYAVLGEVAEESSVLSSEEAWNSKDKDFRPVR